MDLEKLNSHVEEICKKICNANYTKLLQNFNYNDFFEFKKEDYKDFSEFQIYKIKDTEIDINEILNMFSSCYEKYKLKYIINIQIENIIEKHTISIISPLKLYDIKNNIIIYGYNNTRNKPYVTISHRWNSDYGNIDLNKNEKINKMKNIYKKNNKLRYFWIDTLCIDQNNADEKEIEIENMKHYYKNSLITIILSDITIYEKLNYEYNSTWKKFIFDVINLMLIFKSETDDLIPIFDFLYDNFILNMDFKDDLYERSWILQEIILSKYIYIYVDCINSLLSLNQLSNCLVYKKEKTNNLINLCWIIFNSKKIYTIGEILMLTSNRKCLLPNDKIYSILGLIDINISDNINIDYKIKTEDVYMELIREAIKVKDFTWLNIVFNISNIVSDIEPKQIIISSNKIYLKSYVIKNRLKLLVENMDFKKDIKKKNLLKKYIITVK